MKNRIWNSRSRLGSLGFVLMSLAVLSSCAPASESPKDTEARVNYYGSDVNGSINSKNWTLRTGRVVSATYDRHIFIVTLSEDSSNDPCELKPQLNSPASQVSFLVPAKLGTRQISKGPRGFVVVFQYQENSTFKSVMANHGSVKLTKIDHDLQMLEGEMDVSSGTKNQVRGFFRAKICN